MEVALIDKNYETVKQMNDRLIEEHSLTIGVAAEGGFDKSSFIVVPIGQGRIPTAEDFSPCPDAPPVKAAEIHTTPSEVLASQGQYRTMPVDGFFSRDAHGIYDPSGELIGVMKGLERAELYVTMAEKVRGEEALREWSAFYAARRKDGDTHENAITAADIHFSQKFANA